MRSYLANMHSLLMPCNSIKTLNTVLVSSFGIMSRKQPLLHKYGHLMLGLSQAPDKYRQQMIKHAPDEVIQCIAECCHNVLKGNVPLTPAQKDKLKSKREHLRLLAHKKVPIQKKKKALNQKGGLFPLIALAPLIAKAVAAGAISGGVGTLVKKL